MLQGLLHRVQAAVAKFVYWEEEVRAYEQMKVGTKVSSEGLWARTYSCFCFVFFLGFLKSDKFGMLASFQ